jgi:hypothetical protein
VNSPDPYEISAPSALSFYQLSKVKMKKISVLLFVIVSIVASSCAAVVTDTKVPPGQVKKTTAPGQVKKQTGSKSAKEYAPGQKKKG